MQIFPMWLDLMAWLQIIDLPLFLAQPCADFNLLHGIYFLKLALFHIIISGVGCTIQYTL